MRYLLLIKIIVLWVFSCLTDKHGFYLSSWTLSRPILLIIFIPTFYPWLRLSIGLFKFLFVGFFDCIGFNLSSITTLGTIQRVLLFARLQLGLHSVSCMRIRCFWFLLILFILLMLDKAKCLQCFCLSTSELPTQCFLWFIFLLDVSILWRLL